MRTPAEAQSGVRTPLCLSHVLRSLHSLLPVATPANAADPAALPLQLGEAGGLRDSGLISSVYFDSPETLYSYHTRLRKEDYATAVRVRW